MPERSTGKVVTETSNGSPRVWHDISVIIPTVGRSILQQCLQSIADGSVLPQRVIVVDQSSNPDIREWMRVLDERGVEATHLPSGQTGRASGVNRGIECINTGFLAITDDDCLVERDWLQNMRRYLSTCPDNIITGRVESAGDEEVPLVVTSMFPETYSRPRLKFDRLSGGNMGAALAVINQVGHLDEDPVLRCSEDGELAYRALRSGAQITYAPDVVIYHHGWRDTMERQRQYRQYAMSSGGFYGKYLRYGDWFIGLRAMVHYLRELRRLLKSIVTRNAEEARMSRACLRWLIPGILAGLRSRQPRVATQANTDQTAC